MICGCALPSYGTASQRPSTPWAVAPRTPSPLGCRCHLYVQAAAMSARQASRVGPRSPPQSPSLPPPTAPLLITAKNAAAGLSVACSADAVSSLPRARGPGAARQELFRHSAATQGTVDDTTRCGQTFASTLGRVAPSRERWVEVLTGLHAAAREEPAAARGNRGAARLIRGVTSSRGPHL